MLVFVRGRHGGTKLHWNYILHPLQKRTLDRQRVVQWVSDYDLYFWLPGNLILICCLLCRESCNYGHWKRKADVTGCDRAGLLQSIYSIHITTSNVWWDKSRDTTLTTVSAKMAFNFGGTATSQPSLFGGTATTSAPSMFGGFATGLGTSTSGTTGGFSFGAPATTTQASTGFSFGAPTATTASTGLTFGVPTTTTAASTGFNFSFGGASTAGAGGFGFGTNPTTTSAPSFGTTTGFGGGLGSTTGRGAVTSVSN